MRIRPPLSGALAACLCAFASISPSAASTTLPDSGLAPFCQVITRIGSDLQSACIPFSASLVPASLETEQCARNSTVMTACYDLSPSLFAAMPILPDSSEDTAIAS